MIPSSCIAKFNRAQVHFQTLQGQRDAFYGPESYAIRRESNDDFTENRFYIDLVRDPPYDDWGLIFGDGVHNLRSALDHAVYAIGIRESHDPPTNGKRLQFLITEDDAKWDGDKWHIKSLSNCAQAAIKGQQPRGYSDEFAMTPLGGLQEFDNGDKHRIVRVVTSFVRSAQFPLTGLPPGAQCELTWRVGPVKPDTPILTVVTSEPAPNVEMDKGLTLDIAIPHIRENGSETSLLVWESIDMMNQAGTAALNALAPYC